MDPFVLFIGGLIIGLVGGGAGAAFRNPVAGFFGAAVAGYVLFGVVFQTPVTPGGTSSSVLGVPGLLGFVVGFAGGLYAGTKLRPAE